MRAKTHALLQYIFRVQRLLYHTDIFSFLSLLLTFKETCHGGSMTVKYLNYRLHIALVLYPLQCC